MKTQLYGRCERFVLVDRYSEFRYHSRCTCKPYRESDQSLHAYSARHDFKVNRLNGDEKRDACAPWIDRIPDETSYIWINGKKRSDGCVYGKRESNGLYHYECRYDADQDDLEWMRKTDCNYLKRILNAGDLQKLEPDVWCLREMDMAQNRDIGEWWSEKLKLSNIGDLLASSEKIYQIERLTKQITANAISEVDLTKFEVSDKFSADTKSTGIKLGPITTKDIAGLLKALKRNTSVTGLCLANNIAIKDDVIDPLIEIFVLGRSFFGQGRKEPNTTLKAIDLRGTGVTEAGVNKLKKATGKEVTILYGSFEAKSTLEAENKVEAKKERLEAEQQEAARKAKDAEKVQRETETKQKTPIQPQVPMIQTIPNDSSATKKEAQITPKPSEEKKSEIDWLKKTTGDNGEPLTRLDLWRNSIPIGEDGAKSLAKVLPQTKLTELWLYNNSIGDAGAASLALALPQTKLTDLSLINNTIGDVGAASLALALPQTKLTDLSLSNNTIGDAGAKSLAEALALPQAKLTSLDLRYNSIGVAGAESLAKALALPQTQLTSLNLGGNSIGNAGAENLAKALALPQTKLTYLNLGNNSIKDAGAKSLAKALALPQTKLTTLWLGNNFIGDAGAKSLAEALALPQTKLTSLDLDNNSIGEVGTKSLAEALALPQTKLKYLSLRGNSIGVAGAESLAKVLPQTQLTTLNLSGNSIGADGAASLAKALVLPQTKLTDLDLDNNSIGAAGAANLAEVLPQTKLTSLHLDNNTIGNAGAKSLAEALALPETKLTTLWLGNNSIGDAGAKSLAEALVLPQTKLTTLRLDNNFIGAAGAKNLAEVLPETKLMRLDLSNNSIGAAGTNYLIDAVARMRLQGKTIEIQGVSGITEEKILAAMARLRSEQTAKTHSETTKAEVKTGIESKEQVANNKDSKQSPQLEQKQAVQATKELATKSKDSKKTEIKPESREEERKRNAELQQQISSALSLELSQKLVALTEQFEKKQHELQRANANFEARSKILEEQLEVVGKQHQVFVDEYKNREEQHDKFIKEQQKKIDSLREELIKKMPEQPSGQVQSSADSKAQLESLSSQVEQQVTNIVEQNIEQLWKKQAEELQLYTAELKNQSQEQLNTNKVAIQRQIAEEQTKLRAVKGNDAEMQRLTTKLAELERQLAPFQKRDQKRQEKLKVQQYIQQSPHLRTFYYRFQAKLNQLFLAYMVIASGQVEQRSNIMLKLFGKAFDIITLGLGSLISAGVTGVVNRSAEQKAAQISNESIISISETEQAVEKAARTLTERYEYQIQKLTLSNTVSTWNKYTLSTSANDGVEKLADLAVARIIDSCKSGIVNKYKSDRNKSLDEILIDCVFYSQYGSRIFGSSATSIDTEHKVKEPWTDTGIFRHSGVKVFTQYLQTTTVAYYQGTAVCHEATTYDYRWGTDEEVKKLELTENKQPQSNSQDKPISARCAISPIVSINTKTQNAAAAKQTPDQQATSNNKPVTSSASSSSTAAATISTVLQNPRSPYTASQSVAVSTSSTVTAASSGITFFGSAGSLAVTSVKTTDSKVSESKIAITEEQCNNLRVLLPQPLSANSTDVTTLYNKGVDHYKHKEYQEAFKCFIGVLEKCGLALEEDLSQEGVISRLQEMQKANTNHSTIGIDILNYLGSTLVMLGNYREAKQYFLLAHELAPENAEILKHLGMTMYGLQDFKGAIEYFDAAYKIKPNDVETVNFRGLACHILSQDNGITNDLKQTYKLRAVNDFEQASKLPEHACTFNIQGLVQKNRGNNQEALEWFNLALKHKPDDAGILINRGLVHQALGYQNAALEDFNAALQQEPNNPMVRQSLDNSLQQTESCVAPKQ